MDVMKLQRRQFLHLAAGTAASPLVSRFAWAQGYPTRPVRLIVPFAAGGPSDVIARPIGQWLSDRLGQPFVVENRAGGGGNVGAEAVVRAPADGYTLLMVSSPNAINATIHDKLNFDLARDIAGVAGVSRVPNIVVVHPSVPVKTIPEFIAYAKANPGKLSGALGGIGTSGHVASELFKMATGINFVLVPYRGGGPALTDLIAGQVQVYFGPAPLTIESIKSGRLRALAVTSAIRSELLPDIPAVAEFIPGYEASTFLGVGAPRNTPAEIVTKLNTEINAALADPQMKSRLANAGGIALAGAPADFDKLIADEIEKWGKVAKVAGIKAI
jgi:tripartite-type tricarboxylate transporter receptor subunit TctC